MAGFSILDQLSKGIRAYVLLFGLTLIAAAPGVFNLPALDRDESRFAQASKQMLETGDFIQIRYQDGLRNKKPAGIHWLQVATTAIFSSADAKEIWSYRIPSWIAAALAPCFLFWAGMPLIGRRPAFLGAALFGAGILLTSEAHIAKTDAVLVAITTLTVAAFVHLRARTDHPKWLAILFWFAIGFGFLIKGPVTPMVVFLAIAFAGLWEKRDWKWSALLCAGIVMLFLDSYFSFGAANAAVGLVMKSIGGLMIAACLVRFVLDHRDEAWARKLVWWPGPVLFVLMVLPWFISIQIATGGQFAEGALGKDLKDKVAGASEGHGGPPGYHILFLLTHFFPATLFLIPGIVSAIKGVREPSKERNGLIFILGWLIPTWLVFEFLPTKLTHYTLPAYPALALLCGYAVYQLAGGGFIKVKDFASRLAYFAACFSSALIYLMGGVLVSVIISAFGIAYLKADAAGDFKSTDAGTVLEAWSSIGIASWPLFFVIAALILAVGSTALRKFQLALVFAIASSVILGWHIRIAVLPTQTWVQATPAAQKALADVCGMPGQDGCDPVPERDVQAIGFAEPSFVFTTGTEVKISPESSTEIKPIAETQIWVVNLEDPEGRANLARIKEQAAEMNRCLVQGRDVFAQNYSDGDPVHFVGVRVEPGPCKP